MRFHIQLNTQCTICAKCYLPRVFINAGGSADYPSNAIVLGYLVLGSALVAPAAPLWKFPHWPYRLLARSLGSLFGSWETLAELERV